MVAPCRTAKASIRLSQSAWGFRFTSEEWRSPDQTLAVSMSHGTTRSPDSLKKSSNLRKISRRRPGPGACSAPSPISATTTTGKSQSAFCNQDKTRGSGRGFHTSETTLLSSR